MAYEVQVERVTAQTTAVIRGRARIEELKHVVPALCGEVWTFAKALPGPRPGRHLALYLNCDGDLEVGVEVQQPFVGNERVVCSSTPAGLVATTAHWGPYHRLGDAHQAVHQWIAAHGHALAGPSWEIYGHWNDDPAQVRTDVYYLLKE